MEFLRLPVEGRKAEVRALSLGAFLFSEKKTDALNLLDDTGDQSRHLLALCLPVSGLSLLFCKMVITLLPFGVILSSDIEYCHPADLY